MKVKDSLPALDCSQRRSEEIVEAAVRLNTLVIGFHSCDTCSSAILSCKSFVFLQSIMSCCQLSKRQLPFISCAYGCSTPVVETEVTSCLKCHQNVPYLLFRCFLHSIGSGGSPLRQRINILTVSCHKCSKRPVRYKFSLSAHTTPSI